MKKLTTFRLVEESVKFKKIKSAATHQILRLFGWFSSQNVYIQFLWMECFFRDRQIFLTKKELPEPLARRYTSILH